jgi:hypothetical protein
MTSTLFVLNDAPDGNERTYSGWRGVELIDGARRGTLAKDDGLPDPPAFGNPFAWDGRSAREPARAEPIEKPDPQALAECLRQLPQDSIEAHSARDQRLMAPWGSNRLGR